MDPVVLQFGQSLSDSANENAIGVVVRFEFSYEPRLREVELVDGAPKQTTRRRTAREGVSSVSARMAELSLLRNLDPCHLANR